MNLAKPFLSVLLAAIVMTCAVTALAQNKSKSASTPVVGENATRGDLDGATKKVKITRYNSKTNVSFDDTAVTGHTKNPFADIVNSGNPKIQSGFLKIRYNWHDVLAMSASGLSQ